MNTKRRGRVFALIRLDLRVLVMGALTVLLGLLTLILVPLGASLRSGAVLYVGLICYIAAVWAWFYLNRCPHCRKHLGTNTSLYCPNCGEKL